MLKVIISKLLQHLIAQNSWAKPMLVSYSGKVLQLELSPLTAHLIVLEDGALAMLGDTAMTGETFAADASISMSISTALKMLAKNTAAKNELTITGDNEFTTEIGKVLSGLSWDVEDDLSRIIGDSAAYESVKFAKNASETVKQQAVNAAEMLAEYWQEEQPLIAKKMYVETFNQEVDKCRDDVSRLEKRIEKMTKNINKSIN